MRTTMAVALAAALALTGCARDRYESAYDDFVSARQQDAVDRGWIPSMLPEEATDLREAHEPAEDTAVVRATLPGGIIPDDCAEAGAEIGQPPFSPDWMPADVAARGTPVRCGVWSGTVEGTTIVLWTTEASEADAD